MPTWSNWSRTLRATPSAWVCPSPASAVHEVGALSAPWRPVGGSCSASALSVTSDVLVDARDLAWVGQVDEATSTVRVGGGTSVGALAEALAVQGYQLPPLGTSAYPTVAGGLATSLHGSGRHHGTLSDAAWVREMTLVLVSGESVVLSADRPDDAALLAAARVHLGALGLVTEVVLAVQRGAGMQIVTDPICVDDLADDAAHDGWDHTEAWWVPYTNQAQRIRKGPSTDLTVHRGQGPKRLLGQDIPVRLLIEAVRCRPSSAPDVMGFLAKVAIESGAQAGRWDRLAVGPRWLKAVDLEVGVPAARFADALAVVRQVADAHVDTAPLHVPIHLRWVRADEGNLLSTAAGRDTVYVDVAWHPAVKGGAQVLAQIEAGLMAMGGRPHWGKLGFANPGAQFDGLAAFEAVRHQLDPEGRLLNDHLRRLFEGRALRDPQVPL